MPKHEISEDELTEERTPRELLDWVESTIRRIGSTVEGKRALRFRKGLAKELMEEVHPLAIFGLGKYGESKTVKLKPVLGNQKFDAIVRDITTEPATSSFIEITQAHEGENEHLRKLALEREGYVSPIGHVTKKGTKKTGLDVSVEVEAISHDDSIQRDLDMIFDAAKRKEGKEYLPNTSLVIKFDDALHFQESAEIAELDAMVQEKLMNLTLSFSTIYLVGETKKTFREYELPYE